MLGWGKRAVVPRGATGRDVSAELISFPVVTTPRGGAGLVREGETLAPWNVHTAAMFRTETAVDYFPPGPPNAEVVSGNLIARRDLVEHTDVVTPEMLQSALRRAEPPSCLPITSLCTPADALVEVGMATSSRTRIGLWSKASVLRPRQVEPLCWTYAARCPEEASPQTYWVLDPEGVPVKQIFPSECSPMGSANDSPPPSSKANIVLRVLTEQEIRSTVFPALRANHDRIRSLLTFSALHEAPLATTPVREGPLPQELLPFFAELLRFVTAGADDAAYTCLSDRYVVVGVFVGNDYIGPWSELFLSYGYCTFSEPGSYRADNVEAPSPPRAVYIDKHDQYRAATVKAIIDFNAAEEQNGEGELTVRWVGRGRSVSQIPTEHLLRAARTRLLEMIAPEPTGVAQDHEDDDEEAGLFESLNEYLLEEQIEPEGALLSEHSDPEEEARPREFECRYCKARKVTTGKECKEEGRIRIRCWCGGKHRDGKLRMHTKWKEL